MTTTPVYSRATEYLANVSMPDRGKIQDELERMQDCVAELNPLNPTASSLSEHRKGKLEGEIEDLFKKIEAKLRPVVLSPTQAAQKQIQSLTELSAKRTQMSPKQFKQELKKILHPDMLHQLYQAVWIASGSPKEVNYGSQLLKVDNSILDRRFPSLLGLREGTIVEQIIEEIAFDHDFNAASKAKQDVTPLIGKKVQFFLEKFADKSLNRFQVKVLFNAMPLAVQKQLNTLGFQPPFYGRDINPDLYRTLGAHFNSSTGRTTFRVYAPNAREIKLNLTAFGHVQHSIPMIKGSDGVWTVETQHAKPGRSYHLMVTGKGGGEPVKKLDPFAFQNLIHSRKPLEGHPDREKIEDNHESMVFDADKDYAWTDGAWMATRATRSISKSPLAIYEIHPSTWKKKSTGETLNWRELAPLLAQYCGENGYNAVELMALFSHPQPISMGYQITSFFAPNSEMGTWEDFQFFVDAMHKEGISVIADWVPAHFALDKFALSDFDGSPLFEDEDPNYASHPTWGTKVFDFKKKFTQDFLASNADFLLKKLHLDGLRVDAVASMLYMNYDRPNGNRKNYKGTEVDLAAKSFLRNFNSFVHKQYPGVLTMAEESSAFPNVTRSPYERGVHSRSHGLGFDATWHMGWMNDSLSFWQKSAQERLLKPEEGLGTFDLFTHTMKSVDGSSDGRPRGQVVLPYSHDENANAKGTIFAKMAGSTREEKFANGRMALAYQLLRGGGPTLDFMGNELLQSDEWHWRLKQDMENPSAKPRASVQWEELDPSTNPSEYHFHRGAQASRRDLNQLYLHNPGLWDQTDAGMDWFHTDTDNAVLCFHRRGSGQQYACVFNTSDRDFSEYMIPLPDQSHAPELAKLTGVKEVYNTDDANYGGKGRVNASVEVVREHSSGRPTHLKLRLPPFTSIMLEEIFT
ncbi:MAG: alpha amylase C-terminal domain-containing protein [Verrucomicrobia bacterium]|nr:alpha amylase C-terminal domain-containing protein [Verrucomicrobiota bacterium]